MTIPIGILTSLPSTIPLPFIEYTGTAEVNTLISPQNNTAFRRRSRQSKTYATLNVTWKLNDAQYSAFLDFWSETLGNGASAFTMELRYPKISDLDIYLVKIVGDLNIIDTDRHIWEISTVLQVVSKTTVADAATMVSQFFYVAGEESSAAPFEQFYVQSDSSSAADPVPLIVQT